MSGKFDHKIELKVLFCLPTKVKHILLKIRNFYFVLKTGYYKCSSKRNLFPCCRFFDCCSTKIKLASDSNSRNVFDMLCVWTTCWHFFRSSSESGWWLKCFNFFLTELRKWGIGIAYRIGEQFLYAKIFLRQNIFTPNLFTPKSFTPKFFFTPKKFLRQICLRQNLLRQIFLRQNVLR